MLIFGFDCGTVNFGVAAVDVCDKAELKAFMKKWTAKIKNLYSAESLELSKKDWLNNIVLNLELLDQELKQLINMRFVNTFQLIPKLNAETKNTVMENLSIVLNSIVATIGQPDIILIEKQMSINTTAMDIVGGIEMFFRNLKPENLVDDQDNTLQSAPYLTTNDRDNTLQSAPYLTTNDQDNTLQSAPYLTTNDLHNASLPVAFNYWPIKWVRPRNNIQIVIMSPVAKNKVALGGNELGNFIAKYSTNYTANKNHADANFAVFIQAFGLEQLMKSRRAKQKTNDAADAFMMILAYVQDLWT